MNKLLTICLAIGSISSAFADSQIYTVNINNKTGEQISLFFPTATSDSSYNSNYDHYYGFTPVAQKTITVDSDQNFALKIAHDGTAKGGIQMEYYSFFIEDHLIQLETDEVYNGPHPAAGGETTKIRIDGEERCRSNSYMKCGDTTWNPTITFNNDLSLDCVLK